MSVIQFIIVVIWAVFLLSMMISSGVGGAIQAAGLGKAGDVDFILLTLFVGVLGALTGAPLFLWIF